MKTYNTMMNIGRAKHVTNFHDGIKKHKDGSKFYDIAIHSNKKDHIKYINALIKDGYVEKRFVYEN